MARTIAITPKKSAPYLCNLISASILFNNEHDQRHSAFCRFPAEIRNRILGYATLHTRDKVRVSLTCKLLARTLPRPIVHSELAKQIGKTAASAHVTKRVNFMIHLEICFNDYSRPALTDHKLLEGANVTYARRMIKQDWRLCSVCLIFKNTNVINPDHSSAMNVNEVVDLSDEWRCVKKKANRVRRDEDDGDHEMWICPKHKIDPVRMVQLRDKMRFSNVPCHSLRARTFLETGSRDTQIAAQVLALLEGESKRYIWRAMRG